MQALKVQQNRNKLKATASTEVEEEDYYYYCDQIIIC
jgi:hypothetical protein